MTMLTQHCDDYPAPMLLKIFDICAVLRLANKQRHEQTIGGSALHVVHSCFHAVTITDVVDIACRMTVCGTLDIAHPVEIEHKNFLLTTERLRIPQQHMSWKQTHQT